MKTAKLDRFLQISIVFLLGVFVFVLYRSMHETVVAVGDTAPDFSITADNGKTITPTNFGGKLLILNFWATWCPPCIQEMPSLDRLQRTFAGRGLVVVGVSVDKDEKAYRDFLSRVNVAFLTARDPEQKVNSQYGTVQYPESYIIDSNGKVVEKIVGMALWTDERMMNRVQSLL